MYDEKLEKLYQSKIEGLKFIENSQKELDGPLLMSCWDDLYEKADIKLLIIGQENFGWWGEKTSDIGGLMEIYTDFCMALNYHNRKSWFWQGVFKLNGLLNPKLANEPCFLWTNVSKYCTWEGGPISWNDHKFVIENFNILPDEIDVLKPDAVIFLSGPHYDDKIKIQFDENLVFEQINNNISVRELAKIKHPKLPNHTYRTYHPRYLNFQNKLVYLTTIASLIKETA